MAVFLDLQQGLRVRLWAHLLQNGVEQVAIVFATVDPQGDDIVFNAREVYLATPDDFEFHSGYHIELTDEARARIIKKAWDTGTTPVEFHSHPGDAGDLWPAMFSASDMYGFSDYVPHCRWRLRGRPYLAVVVSQRHRRAGLGRHRQPTRRARRDPRARLCLGRADQPNHRQSADGGAR
jgi:hypothetical protein